MFRFIQVLNVKFDDISDSIVEHEKAGSFIDSGTHSSTCVDQVENRCQDLIHALNILNFRVESGINVQNPGHIVIAISSPLHFLIRQKGFVLLVVLPID